MADRIQLRRDTSTNWSAANPVLASGEQGFETDTLKLKIGNGVSAWNSLAYVIDVSSLATSADVTSAVNNLVDAAPGTLDTLNELAAALGDDANFASTVTSSLALKADTTTVTSSLALKADTTAVTSSLALKADASSLATVATSGDYADVTGTPSIPSALTDLSITDGVEGQVLTTDGSGGFAFADTAGGGSFEAVASGTLANGDKVVINALGTVSVAGEETTLIEAGGLGTEISVDSASTTYTATAYDSNSNKVVVMYASGNTIRAFVGTVSGKNITFGAVSIKNTGGPVMEKTFRAVFDPSSNKVVVAYVEYIHGDRLVRSMVGTISGTSISFGSQAYVEPNASFYTRSLALAFDSSSNKVIFSYVSASSNQVRSIVGTVSGTSISFGSVTNSSASANYDDITSVYDPDNNKVVVIYRKGSNFYSIVGTVSGTGISFGSEFQIVTGGAGENPSLVYDTYSNKVVFIYRNGTTGTAIVGTVSGNSISFGTPVIFESGGASGYYAAIFDPSENKVVISYLYYSSPETGRVVVGTVSGTSISFNTPVQFSSQESKEMAIAFDSNSNRSVISWKSGKSIVFKTEDTFSVGATNLTSENFVGISDGAYSDGATATIQTAGAVDDAQSGLTAGQAYFLQEDGTLNTTPDTTRVFAGVALSATELMIGKDMSSTAVVPYTDSDVATYLTGNGYDTATNIISTITDSAPATLDTLNELAAALGDDANFASTVTSSLALKADTTTVNSSLALKADTSSLSTVATTGAYSDLTGTPAAVVPGGSFEAVASGTLANGDKVVVNADGTVSVVSPTGGPVTGTDPAGFGTQVVASSEANNQDKSFAVFDSNTNKVVVLYNATVGGVNGARVIVGTVSGKSISFGSPVAIVGAIMTYGDITFDSNANKVVVVMSNFSNSSRGEAYVGTVSGTSISFGSAVVFETSTNTTWPTATFDSNTNKVVVAYNAFSGGFGGRAIVGTVSGNSISFGSSVALPESRPSFTRATFDSNSNKVVLVYKEESSTNGVAVVGTVSGDSISFGSPTSFVNLLQYYPGVAIDSSSKMVVAYRDPGNSNYGTAKVGTISGTSISFGSAVVFESVNAPYTTEAIFDSSANKFLIAYTAYTGTPVGKIIAGTVSGTSISFDSPVVFDSPGGRGNTTTMTFDSASNKAVLVFGTSNNNHESVVYQAEDQDIRGPNLTSENFVGISNAAYSDGATATIQTVGSVDDAQSGLTAGKKYYVQTNGALSTIPADPSVFAGTAVSTTKLIVKG